LQTALNGKQATITDGSLSISKISGSQTLLTTNEDEIRTVEADLSGYMSRNDTEITGLTSRISALEKDTFNHYAFKAALTMC